MDTFDPVGRVSYIFDEDPPRPLLWHESANNAFYITLDALNRFQQVDSIGCNPYVIPAIGLWFLATESFVSTLYKIARRDAELDQARVSRIVSRLQPLKLAKFGDKLAAINEHFSHGRAVDRDLALRLGEFAAMRNALFHDLTTVKKPEFHRTRFTSHVENVNEAHLMQAAVLTIDAFGYFRHLFSTVDLMPSIQIGIAVDKLDVLAREILFPTFRDILTAKGLESDIELNPKAVVSPAKATRFLGIAVKFDGPMSPKKTADTPRISVRYVERAIASRPVDDDKFQVHTYMTKTPGMPPKA
jgi:hypothetical protein